MERVPTKSGGWTVTRDALSRVSTYRHTSGAWVRVDDVAVHDRLPQLLDALEGIAKGGSETQRGQAAKCGICHGSGRVQRRRDLPFDATAWSWAPCECSKGAV